MRSLSLATIFAALSGFAIVILAPHILPDATAVTQFLAVWGLFFAVTGLLDGIMQETTRAVAAARETPARADLTTRPVHVALAAATVVSLTTAFLALWWAPALIPSLPGAAAGLFAVGLASYTFQTLLSGFLSGLKKWRAYAALVALDSGIRLALALVAWAAGWGLGSFVVITVIGAASWIAVIAASPAARSALSAPVDCTPRAYRRGVVSAMVASGASAALTTGFAPAVVAFGHPPRHALVAALLQAVVLTRAPILVPMQRFLSALIVKFVQHREHIHKALRTPVAAVLGVGCAGAIPAWLIGPWIMVLLWGEDYRVPGVVLAVLTIGSACTGTLMITGAAALAFDNHSAYVAGWVSATAVAFATLALPIGLEVAMCAALIIGPATGSVVHLWGLRRAPVGG